MEKVIQQNLKAREKVMVACPLLPAHRARPAKDNKICSHAPIQELVISSPSQRSTSPSRSSLDNGPRHLLPTRTRRSAKDNKNSSHAPIQELVLPSPSETNTTPPYISFKEMMTRSHSKTNKDNSVRVGKIEAPYRTCFTNKCPWRWKLLRLKAIDVFDLIHANVLYKMFMHFEFLISSICYCPSRQYHLVYCKDVDYCDSSGLLWYYCLKHTCLKIIIMCGTRGGTWGPDPPPTPWKITKYRVFWQYRSGSPEKSQDSIQCWAIIGTPAKRH